MPEQANVSERTSARNQLTNFFNQNTSFIAKRTRRESSFAGRYKLGGMENGEWYILHCVSFFVPATVGKMEKEYIIEERHWVKTWSSRRPFS